MVTVAHNARVFIYNRYSTDWEKLVMLRLDGDMQCDVWYWCQMRSNRTTGVSLTALKVRVHSDRAILLRWKKKFLMEWTIKWKPSSCQAFLPIYRLQIDLILIHCHQIEHLQVLLQCELIMATKFISKLTQSRTLSESPNLLDHGLQLHLNQHTIPVRWNCWSLIASEGNSWERLVLAAGM